MASSWQLRHELWQLPAGGAIMGILNVTPDSFSDGGLHSGAGGALAHAIAMLEQGADIIDIGGESTRPGADAVDLQEELRRVIPILNTIRISAPRARISIDTRHVEVASAALELGADIINDVSGLISAEMRQICAQSHCGVVMMHMQGLPATMQYAPKYEDVIAEVKCFFEQRVALALGAGINPASICLDPGIGFGKTTQQNLMLIEHLEQLRLRPEFPMMMALSRKRFLGEILGNVEAGRAALSTLSMSILAAERGAEIHRVHDVAALHQALTLRGALKSMA